MMSGLVFRKQPGRPAKKSISDDELLELYRTHTATEIAAMYDVKPSTVRSWVTKIRKVVEADAEQ